MNCHGFETVVNDLARNQIMDAAAKTDAFAHKDACARCAARLADEQMLTAGLKQLAASVADEQAPPRIEAALLAALGERQKEAIAPQRKSNWRRLAVAAAIAAILVIIALVALRLDKQPPTQQVKQTDQTEQAKPQTTEIPKQTSPEPYIRDKDKQTASGEDDSPQKLKPPRRVKQTIDRTNSVNARNHKPAAVSNVNEIATDFIPLVQGEAVSRMEGGQVVRVEMPRSALLSYGLPMNMERANERIKADLVIGNDGLARAIRFVR